MALDFFWDMAFGSDHIGGSAETNFADKVFEEMSGQGIKTNFELLFGTQSAREDSGNNVKIGGVDWMGFGAAFDGDGAKDLSGEFSTQMFAQVKANGGGEIQSADQTMGKFKMGTEGSSAKWTHMGQDVGNFSGSKITGQITRSEHFDFDWD